MFLWEFSSIYNVYGLERSFAAKLGVTVISVIMAAVEVGVSAGTGVQPTAVKSQVLCFVLSKTRPYDFQRCFEYLH